MSTSARSDGAAFGARRFATARFPLGGAALGLDVYWLEGYADFLPFADATSGDTTYGAGCYLLDMVKGADLGTHGGRLVFDFNLAYNPSCSYDPRRSCPVAPPRTGWPSHHRRRAGGLTGAASAADRSRRASTSQVGPPSSDDWRVSLSTVGDCASAAPVGGSVPAPRGQPRPPGRRAGQPATGRAAAGRPPC